MIKKLLEESPGVYSSTRAVWLSVVALCILVTLTMTAGVMFKVITDVPPGLVTLLSLVTGIAGAAKVVQQRTE